LIGKDGAIVARFESKVKPDDPEVTAAIEKALAQ
jgi:glutathione peroxidase